MTEGIIQKAFEKYTSHIRPKYNDSEGTDYTIPNWAIQELQQELMAEIKKEIEQTAYSCPYAVVKKAYAYTLKQLIGDSKQ